MNKNSLLPMDYVRLYEAYKSAVRKRIIEGACKFINENNRNPTISELQRVTKTPMNNLSMYIKQLNLMGLIEYEEKTTEKGRTKEVRPIFTIKEIETILFSHKGMRE